jgi:hypothetical protein
VQRDARPCETLHVRHVGIIIKVRVVLGLFLNDTEDTGWRLPSLLAARHRRSHDQAAGIVDTDLLVAQRYDRHNRLGSGAQLDDGRRRFGPDTGSTHNIAHRGDQDEGRKDKT